MRGIDERTARWVVQGVASGEPLTAVAAAAALNGLFALDPDRVPTAVVGVLNGILVRDDPGGSGVAAIQDRDTGDLLGFMAVGLGR